MSTRARCKGAQYSRAFSITASENGNPRWMIAARSGAATWVTVSSRWWLASARR